MILRLQLKSSDFQLIPVFKRIEKKQRDLNLKLETWMRTFAPPTSTLTRNSFCWDPWLHQKQEKGIINDPKSVFSFKQSESFS